MEYFTFLDYEFNQGPTDKREEIIAVGCVIYNDQYEEVESYYSLSRPCVHTKMMPHVTKLTGIRQKDIDNAPTFAEVSNELREILKKYPDNVFYAWGCDDFRALVDTCHMNKCKVLLKQITEIKDIQNEIISSVVDNGERVWYDSKKLSLMNHFYNQPQLKAHNALNDARMLGRVYAAYKKRGNYDFKTNSFERMDGLTKDDILIANKTVYGERLKERRNRIIGLKKINRTSMVESTLDGNIYHHIAPLLNEPLFTTKRRRKYSTYTVQIIFNEADVCIDLCFRSPDGERQIKLEADGNVVAKLRPAIKIMRGKR